MKNTLCWIAIAALTASVYGDVRYTKKMTFAQGGDEGFSTKTVTYLKGKRERKETIMEMGPVKTVQTELTLCDLEKRARLDADLKIYTEDPLRPEFQAAGPSNPFEEGSEKPPAKVASGTGTYTMHYKVQDFGPEKVAGVDAHHYKIHMTFTSKGCCGDSQSVLEREVWVANLPRLICPVRDATGDFSLKSHEPQANPCKVKVVRTGDVKLADAASQGEPVKEILYHEGKPTMTTELVEYSTASLDDHWFSLDGLKAVSDSEFRQQQQQKMMQMFQR